MKISEQTETNHIQSQQTDHLCQILSGSAIKVMALVFMLIDHTAGALLIDCPITFTFWGQEISLYLLLRYIGRLAFPLYAFLLVEGFIHTSDRKKYGLNLILFAMISEIPWNLLHSGNLLFPDSQNVFFTLTLGYFSLCVLERADFSSAKKGLYLVAFLTISIILKADYSVTGYGFILLLYALREEKILQAVIGCCILPSKWIAGLAFIPINLYNGKRGFIQNAWLKYLFYFAYPLHMMILYYYKYIH